MLAFNIMTDIIHVLNNILFLFSCYYLIVEGQFLNKWISNCLFCLHTGGLWAEQLSLSPYRPLIKRSLSVILITFSSYYIYVEEMYMVRPLYSFLIWINLFLTYYEVIGFTKNNRWPRYVNVLLYFTICHNMVYQGTYAVKYVYFAIMSVYLFFQLLDVVLEYIIESDK